MRPRWGEAGREWGIHLRPLGDCPYLTRIWVRGPPQAVGFTKTDSARFLECRLAKNRVLPVMGEAALAEAALSTFKYAKREVGQ
jgi:hypothetical protein